MKKLLLASILSAASITAQAGGYFGAGVAEVNYSEELVDDLKPLAVVAHIGIDITDYMAIEGRAGTGIREDSQRIVAFNTIFDAELEITQIYGVYGRFKYPADFVEPYVIFGRTYGEVEWCISSLCSKDSENDFSYGAGLSVYFNNQSGLSFEYTKYFDESDFEATALTLSLSSRF